MKLHSASAGPSGVALLSLSLKVVALSIATIVAFGVAYLVFSNLNEHRQWSEYARENGCYISSQEEIGHASDDHGGRLATDPAPKVWSCDNGMKFTRY